MHIAIIRTYILIHRQTVSLYYNSSVWLNTQDSRSWDETRLTHSPIQDSTSKPRGNYGSEGILNAYGSHLF